MQMKHVEKYVLVRCRHLKTDRIKMMVKHVTDKTWFLENWVVEDTNNSSGMEHAVLKDDLAELRVEVAKKGMKNTKNATKQEMIDWMNEPKEQDEVIKKNIEEAAKKEDKELRKTIEDSKKAEEPKKRGRPPKAKKK